MNYYIGIEDVAANALIVLLRETEKRFVSYVDMELYGTQVVKILNEKQECAVFVMSRISTNTMLRNYSDFFEEVEENNIQGLKLVDGKNVDDLVEKFRGYLALDVLLAFVSPEAVSILKG